MEKLISPLVDTPPGICSRSLSLQLLFLNMWLLTRGPFRPVCFRARQWEAQLSKHLANTERKIPAPWAPLCCCGGREVIEEKITPAILISKWPRELAKVLPFAAKAISNLPSYSNESTYIQSTYGTGLKSLMVPSLLCLSTAPSKSKMQFILTWVGRIYRVRAELSRPHAYISFIGEWVIFLQLCFSSFSNTSWDKIIPVSREHVLGH